MLKKEDYYGGSSYFVELPEITASSPRVITLNVDGGGALALPPCKEIHTREEKDGRHVRGRPRFIFINLNESTLTVNHDSGKLFDLEQDKWIAVSPREIDGNEPDSWIVIRSGSINSTAYCKGERPSELAEEQFSPTFSPYCCFKSECECVDGLYPLDGQEVDGFQRPSCLAPMYQDIALNALNRDREAIRARDVVMPSKIIVRFSDGEFTPDTNHPWYGVHTLSDYFFDALYQRSTVVGDNPAKPIALEYVNGVTANTSNWHHCTYGGDVNGASGPEGVWTHGPENSALQCRKHVWEASIPYGPPDDPDVYTLVVRFTMEHTLCAFGTTTPTDPQYMRRWDAYAPSKCNEPGAVQWGECPDNVLGASGNVATDMARGMWGSLFTLAVFTDELNIEFEDDSTEFTPAGWDNAVTFNRNDPAVSAISYAYKNNDEGATPESKKAIHPQCVIFGHLPTTFHAPVGTNYIPLINRQNKRNLQSYYAVPNGTPWINTESCTDVFVGDVDDLWPNYNHGIFYNIVFGKTPTSEGGNYFGKGMTIGGGFGENKPMEVVLLENTTSGNGMTFLKSSKNAWNQTCGKLDLGAGSSVEIYICVDFWQDNFSICDGHFSEPFAGTGGTHTAFRNAAGGQLCGKKLIENCGPPGGINTVCCMPLYGDSSARGDMVYECAELRTCRCNQAGGMGNCELAECSAGTANRQGISLQVSDYKYNAYGSQTSRYLSYYNAFEAPVSERNWYLNTRNRLGLSPITPTVDFESFNNWEWTPNIGTWNTFDDGGQDYGFVCTGSTGAGEIVRSQISFDDTSNNPDFAENEYQGHWPWFRTEVLATVKLAINKAGVGFMDQFRNGYGAAFSHNGTHIVAEIAKYYEISGQKFKDILATQSIQTAIDTVRISFRVDGCALQASVIVGATTHTITATDCSMYSIAEETDYNNFLTDSVSDMKPCLFTEFSAALKFKLIQVIDRDNLYTPQRGRLNFNHASSYLDFAVIGGLRSCQDTTRTGFCVFAGCGEDSGVIDCDSVIIPECTSQCIETGRDYPNPNPSCCITEKIEFYLDGEYTNLLSGQIYDMPMRGTMQSGSGQYIPPSICTPDPNSSGITYGGGPSPFNCFCNFDAESCQQTIPQNQPCERRPPTCISPDKSYFNFYLPLRDVVWDAPTTTAALNHIPFICRGISVYGILPIACD